MFVSGKALSTGIAPLRELLLRSKLRSPLSSVRLAVMEPLSPVPAKLRESSVLHFTLLFTL
jgi:hypothetical protein